MILFEREEWMPNWSLDMDVVSFGRAHTAKNVPDIFRHFHHLTHKDMGNVLKAPGALWTMAVRVFTASRRSVCTFPSGQAIDNHEG